MIRRWLGPALLALVAAVIAYNVALHAAPRVLMAAAMKRVGQGGTNRFTHPPLATSASRAIVRPSPDLAYSICPFDLSAGPLAITVPASPARYWSLSVFRSDTDVAFVRNNIDTGGGAIRVVVAMRAQAVPAGWPAVRVDDARGIALIRTLVEDRGRFAAIDRARRAATCAPLR